MTEATEHNWQALAEAIILQAVADYRRVVRKLLKEPTHEEALADKLDVEQFFLSEWFCMLTNLDGKRLLTRLKREIQKSEGNL
jgi:hypothetical protein